MSQNNIKSLENDLWESADALREGSKLSSQEYCMPVLGLIYLRYAFTRFKYVEAEILKDLLRLFNNDALNEIKDS